MEEPGSSQEGCHRSDVVGRGGYASSPNSEGLESRCWKAESSWARGKVFRRYIKDHADFITVVDFKPYKHGYSWEITVRSILVLFVPSIDDLKASIIFSYCRKTTQGHPRRKWRSNDSSSGRINC